ncbi:unnamed protein product [Protopolystoma xenopodis]|uniref:Uncharacterized protein n=1 Tax=Protopolystoma xenopodis TaxID=117903 RepID=A0A448W9N3_9PLAT|nr:unnamed protein product [Protopolystoma xenopodis]
MRTLRTQRWPSHRPSSMCWECGSESAILLRRPPSLGPTAVSLAPYGPDIFPDVSPASSKYCWNSSSSGYTTPAVLTPRTEPLYKPNNKSFIPPPPPVNWVGHESKILNIIPGLASKSKSEAVIMARRLMQLNLRILQISASGPCPTQICLAAKAQQATISLARFHTVVQVLNALKQLEITTRLSGEICYRSLGLKLPALFPRHLDRVSYSPLHWSRLDTILSPTPNCHTSLDAHKIFSTRSETSRYSRYFHTSPILYSAAQPDLSLLLLDLIITCNRSIAHEDILLLAIGCLANLAMHPPLAANVAVWWTPIYHNSGTRNCLQQLSMTAHSSAGAPMPEHTTHPISPKLEEGLTSQKNLFSTMDKVVSSQARYSSSANFIAPILPSPDKTLIPSSIMMPTMPSLSVARGQVTFSGISRIKSVKDVKGERPGSKCLSFTSRFDDHRCMTLKERGDIIGRFKHQMDFIDTNLSSTEKNEDFCQKSMLALDASADCSSSPIRRHLRSLSSDSTTRVNKANSSGNEIFRAMIRLLCLPFDLSKRVYLIAEQFHVDYLNSFWAYLNHSMQVYHNFISKGSFVGHSHDDSEIDLPSLTAYKTSGWQKTLPKYSLQSKNHTKVSGQIAWAKRSFADTLLFRYSGHGISLVDALLGLISRTWRSRPGTPGLRLFVRCTCLLALICAATPSYCLPKAKLVYLLQPIADSLLSRRSSGSMAVTTGSRACDSRQTSRKRIPRPTHISPPGLLTMRSGDSLSGKLRRSISFSDIPDHHRRADQILGHNYDLGSTDDNLLSMNTDSINDTGVSDVTPQSSASMDYRLLQVNAFTNVKPFSENLNLRLQPALSQVSDTEKLPRGYRTHKTTMFLSGTAKSRKENDQLKIGGVVEMPKEVLGSRSKPSCSSLQSHQHAISWPQQLPTGKIKSFLRLAVLSRELR